MITVTVGMNSQIGRSFTKPTSYVMKSNRFLLLLSPNTVDCLIKKSILTLLVLCRVFSKLIVLAKSNFQPFVSLSPAVSTIQNYLVSRTFACYVIDDCVWPTVNPQIYLSKDSLGTYDNVEFLDFTPLSTICIPARK